MDVPRPTHRERADRAPDHYAHVAYGVALHIQGDHRGATTDLAAYLLELAAEDGFDRRRPSQLPPKS